MARPTSLSLKGRGTGAKRQGEGKIWRGKTPEVMLERSRQLRQNATEAENKLWQYIRAGRLIGWKFRRQVLIGNYIADFVCGRAKLIIELDGSQHADALEYDARRTAFLQSEGYQVLRIWNNDVMRNIDYVLELILANVATPLPAASRLSLSPSGRG